MPSLKHIERDLKRRFGEGSSAAKAIGKIVKYTTIVATGATATGGALTLPLLLIAASEAVEGLARLISLLLPTAKAPAEHDGLAPSQRIGSLFYLLAQQCYVQATAEVLEGCGSGALDKERHSTVLNEVAGRATEPLLADASHFYGKDPSAATIELYDSYKLHLRALMRGWSFEHAEGDGLASRIDEIARLKLRREVAQNQWLSSFLLLSQVESIHQLLNTFRVTIDPAEDSWSSYLLELLARTKQPIWGEEFDSGSPVAIADLFVQPRYRYLRQGGSQSKQPSAEMPNTPLLSFLAALFSARTNPRELVFVMGGPGLGKTSVVDMFAASLAGDGVTKVVSVAAKRLKAREPLLPTIRNVLAESDGRVASALDSSDRVFLLIDGFDELAQATRDDLGGLFSSAQQLVADRLSSGWRVLLSGRPTLFSENDVAIPAGSHVVTLEPFGVAQVEEWSRKWNAAKQDDFDGVNYMKLDEGAASELASQPMLLYLFASMRRDGQPLFTDKAAPASSRFHIYRRILDWICERQAAKVRDGWSAGELRRFLRTTGLVAHQQGDRFIHWSNLKEAIREEELTEPGNVEAKSYATILSFAFVGRDERSWEFTHKSFGEALASEKLISVLTRWGAHFAHGDGWVVRTRDAAKAWVEHTGPSVLSGDILVYLRGWIRQLDASAGQPIVERMPAVLLEIIGDRQTSQLDRSASRWRRPVVQLQANAVRSWMMFAGCLLERYFPLLTELPGWLAGSLDDQAFRDAIVLCELAAPILAGDFDSLFLQTRRLTPAWARRSERSLPEFFRLSSTAAVAPGMGAPQAGGGGALSWPDRMVASGFTRDVGHEVQSFARAGLDPLDGIQLLTGRSIEGATAEKLLGVLEGETVTAQSLERLLAE